MPRTVVWGFVAASAGTLAVFSAYLSTLGVPDEFLPFLVRSLVVLVTTFVLVFAAVFLRTGVDSRG